MRKYEILPHIADIRIKIYGDSLNELFSSAIDGMNSIIAGRIEISQKNNLKEEIFIDSVEVSALLIDFLSEVLTLSHQNKCLYKISSINELNQKHFDCLIEGYFVNEFVEDIKAVTYTEANVIRNKENILETIIVFDI